VGFVQIGEQQMAKSEERLLLHLPPAMPHLGSMPRHERVHGHTEKQVQLSNHCFGCGPANKAGLQLKFVLDKERKRFVCRFRLQRRFVGPPGHSHGGIIATILDEAMGKVNKLHGVTALTARMEVDYRKPVPLGKPLVVEGWEVRKRGREHTYAAEIRDREGLMLAESRGKFIEIDPHRMFAKYLKKKHSDAT
jgi:uncharacterized protein (TIGR00369 family)